MELQFIDWRIGPHLVRKRAGALLIKTLEPGSRFLGLIFVLHGDDQKLPSDVAVRSQEYGTLQCDDCGVELSLHIETPGDELEGRWPLLWRYRVQDLLILPTGGTEELLIEVLIAQVVPLLDLSGLSLS